MSFNEFLHGLFAAKDFQQSDIEPEWEQQQQSTPYNQAPPANFTSKVRVYCINKITISMCSWFTGVTQKGMFLLLYSIYLLCFWVGNVTCTVGVTQCFVFSFQIGDLVGDCNCFLYPERDGKSQNLITFISDGENYLIHNSFSHTECYSSAAQGNSTLITNPKLTYMYTMNNECDTTSKKENLHVSLQMKTEHQGYQAHTRRMQTGKGLVGRESCCSHARNRKTESQD